MPGVKRQHQESGDSSKAETVFGHLFGAIGVVASAGGQTLRILLSMGIQNGLAALAGWAGGDAGRAGSHIPHAWGTRAGWRGALERGRSPSRRLFPDGRRRQAGHGLRIAGNDRPLQARGGRLGGPPPQGAARAARPKRAKR
jgi:hypothetical protein